jgi:hypothetical protein
MARDGFERQGPLPTVSHFRGHGVTRLLVTCLTALDFTRVAVAAPENQT